MQCILSITLVLAIWTVATSGQFVGKEKCGIRKSREFAACSLVPTVMGRKNSTFPNDGPSGLKYCA